MSTVSEDRLNRIEDKIDTLAEGFNRLDRSFVELVTEQRVRDQERAKERAELLALIPTVRQLQAHIERLQDRITSVETTGSHPMPSLPPISLTDGPTQPGSSMLPAYPDEPLNTSEVEELTRENTESRGPSHLGIWDVAMRMVGVFENLAKGFIAYQRMWGFIALGIFGPPGLAVGLAQAWMITHPGGEQQPAVLPITQPVIESAREEPDKKDEEPDIGFGLPGPEASEAE